MKIKLYNVYRSKMARTIVKVVKINHDQTIISYIHLIGAYKDLLFQPFIISLKLFNDCFIFDEKLTNEYMIKEIIE